MNDNVKKWLKTLICIVLTVFSISVGFSAWNIIDDKDVKEGTVSTMTANLTPCCYIESKSNKKYTSIEDALDVAYENGKNDVIIVMPGTNPTIKRDCFIDTGDTLKLVYNEAKEYTCRNDEKRQNFDQGFADHDATSVAKYRKINLTISEGIHLTNYGTLIIGGKIGCLGNVTISGLTNDLYCQISMEANSQISNEKKTRDSNNQPVDGQDPNIECYGYIKETAKNNGSKIISTAGTIAEPIVIYDYRGGNYVSAMIDNLLLLTKPISGVFPFSIYDFPNIQSKMELHSGTSVRLFLTLYMASTKNFVGTDNSYALSNNDNSLLRFTNLCEFKYTARNWNGKESYTSNTYNESYNQMTTIIFKGNAYVGKLSLNTKDVFGLSFRNIESSSFHLPISYRFKFVQNTGVFYARNKMKFLPGSCFQVDPGAGLSIDNSVSFYSQFKDEIKSRPYPSNKPAASLIVNGTMKINSEFGGNITCSSNTGKVVCPAGFVGSVTSLEFSGDSKDSKKVNHIESAVGKILYKQYDESVSNGYMFLDSQNGSFESNKSYTSKQIYSTNNDFGWYDISDSNVSYRTRIHSDMQNYTDPNANSTISFKKNGENVTVKSLVANDSTRFAFDGYYYDAQHTSKLQYNSSQNLYLIEPSVADSFIGTDGYLTLYAKWVDKNKLITIQFRKYDSTGQLVNGDYYPGSIGENYNISEFTSSYTDTDRPVKILANAKITYEFTKWIVRDASGNEVKLTNNVFSAEEGNSIYYVDPVYSETNWLKYIVTNDKIKSWGITYYAIKEIQIDGTSYKYEDTNEHEGYVKATNVLTILKETGSSNDYKVNITFADGQIITVDNKTDKYILEMSKYQTLFNKHKGPIKIDGKIN